MRKTLSETHKSKWLNEKERKPRREPKPQFPLVSGTIECHAVLENGKVCGKLNEVQANAQVEVSYPDSTFWVIDRCNGCGSTLTGFAVLGDSSTA